MCFGWGTMGTGLIQQDEVVMHMRPGSWSSYRISKAETIEEKIIELQEKKQTVFDCTVGNSNQALPAVPAVPDPGGSHVQ